MRKINDKANYKKAKVKELPRTVQDDNGFVRIDPRYLANA
ncbi:hypothetical protein NO1_0695 [Candidatus Termititenax aidoneus]|uniref:Uncharacterized protein n=1 Tax=Termititenax aidoneus TaxID=2218524 RepID=A0A388TC08_TERA1|nr:hypothetical protein NO1_0695 [Candidatus Termititenax aidoneus]